MMAMTEVQESSVNCTPEPKEQCRVCMTKLKTEGIPIFGDCTRPDISADLITLGSVELSRDDDLPKYLCKNCLKWLKSAVLFRETAQQSDLILKRKQKRKHNTLLRKYTKPIKIETLTHSSKNKYNPDTTDSTETPTYPAFLLIDIDEIKQNITKIKNEKSDDEVDLDIQIEMDTDKYKTESGEVEVLIDSDDKKKAKKTSTSPNLHCMACALDFSSTGEYDQHLIKYHDDTAKTKSEVAKCEICKNTYTSHGYKQHLKCVHNVGDVMPVQDIFLTNQALESDVLENFLNNQLNFSNVDDKDNWKKQLEKMKCEICKKSYSSRYYRAHLKRVHKVVDGMPEQDFLTSHESDDQESSIISQVNLTDKKDESNYVNDNQLDVANRTSIDEIQTTKDCEICGKSFSLLKYELHFKIKHGPQADKNKKYCKTCKTNFSQESYYHHIKTHHSSLDKTKSSKKTSKKERVQCKVCKNTYSGRYIYHHLRQHKYEENQKHTGIGRFICDQCGKMFNCRNTFNNHCLTHTDLLPYKCDYCPYRTRTKSLLDIHVRTHTGDYKYKCTQCSACLVTKSNLNAHMRRHRGAIDFMCDQCSRGFYSKLELERHISAVHLGIRNHICNVCGKAFGYRSQMTKHTKKVHKREKLHRGRLPLYLQMELKKKKETEEKDAHNYDNVNSIL